MLKSAPGHPPQGRDWRDRPGELIIVEDLDAGPARDLPAEIAEVQASVADLDKRIDRLLDQMEAAAGSPSLGERLAQLEGDKAKAAAHLEALEQELRTAPADPVGELRDAASVCIAALTYHLPGTAGEPAGERLSEADAAVIFNSNLHKLLSRIDASRDGGLVLYGQDGRSHRVDFASLPWAQSSAAS